jgi:tetratricopeptide (TPR) repeat protein/tRNA A-37 threonylcarbamoyl transferase component Bud32
MSDLVGRHLGRYEIVSLLGAGGMGEVYRARDTQLGRQVAVKVLGAKALEDPSLLERFEKEARAVALLSHPNILDIHDFGVDGGVAYAVTELLEGKNLRERMEGTSLPLSKALEIGRAVAEGLAAAHGKGIVHRDIKPENIFLTSTGQVKILDFGIARLKGRPVPDPLDAGTPTLTSTVTGPAMGTVGYMSPEQVRGLPAEARSDIFSLGCVLYEMVTGQRAFRAETADDTMLAILHRDPPPMGAVRPDVPPALALIVGRCLEKQPDERFESARDVAFALQAVSVTRETVVVEPPIRRRRGSRAARVGVIGLAAVAIAAIALLGVRHGLFGAPALPKEKHLAVMRFEAEDNMPGLQEIADGLTEEVRRGLALLEEAAPGSFWVVPRAEAERADVGIKTHQDLGRKFNVTAIVTGGLQRHGDRLRLDLAAIAPSTQRALRNAAIEDSVSNLSAFQEEPVLRVAQMLALPVSPEARQRLKGTATTMTAAFEAYLNGAGALAEAKDEKAVDRAVALLETAVSRDPLFAAGRIALGRAYLRKFELSKKVEWADRAVAAGEQAVRESAWPAEAYLLLVAANAAAGRSADALGALEKAERVAPSSAAVHLELAATYQAAKRFADAEQELQRAVFLQPGYWLPHHMLARLYQAQGRYEVAATQDREVIACVPLFTRGYNNLGAMYHYIGRDDDARDAFERSVAIEPSRSALSNLGALYFNAARFADSAAMFERALQLDDTRHLTWGNLGYAYHYGPTPAKAEGCFRRAVELAEKQRQASPNDPWILAYLAGYYAMLDRREKGLEVLAQVVKQTPREKELMAQVAETFEDLGERARALEWVARSFEAGVSPSRFEGRPTLRGLVADEGYRRLAAEMRRNP